MPGDVLLRVMKMDTLAGGWLLRNRKFWPPLRCRADRAWSEAATAVGTDIVQMGFDAVCAERALVAADPRHC